MSEIIDLEESIANRKQAQKLYDYEYKNRFPYRGVINGIQDRAEKYKIPCTLNMAWAHRTYTGFCSLTNIPFQWIRGVGSENPYHHSVDRINPNIGYLQENCRWVLLCMNTFKGVHSDETIYEIAKKFVQNYELNLRLCTC